jgi:hypothetical protein
MQYSYSIHICTRFLYSNIAMYTLIGRIISKEHAPASAVWCFIIVLCVYVLRYDLSPAPNRNSPSQNAPYEHERSACIYRLRMVCFTCDFTVYRRYCLYGQFTYGFTVVRIGYAYWEIFNTNIVYIYAHIHVIITIIAVARRVVLRNICYPCTYKRQTIIIIIIIIIIQQFPLNRPGTVWQRSSTYNNRFHRETNVEKM